MVKKLTLFFLALLLGAYFSNGLVLNGKPQALYQVGPSVTTFTCSIPYTGSTKICLTMIVKNESHIIKRCLDSVKGIVDCISICDTGSTDNSVEIIEQFMKENQIPGKVHRHPWQNFGHNRTLAAEAAKQTLQELGFSLSHTYLLLLDADMVLNIAPSFDKRVLMQDAYSVLQKNDTVSYYNLRLIRASLPWECIGATHEYWSCPKPFSEIPLSTLTIDDREDGGCKGDKWERDLKWLTETIKQEPQNARHMFYLAHTHKTLGNFDEAIHWFQARIQQGEGKGKGKGEIWFSKLMMGEIYEQQGFWNEALRWYLDAYSSEPKCAEPLQKIAAHYYLNGENQLALLFAKQGSLIPYPEENPLFTIDAVYQYQLDEILSITAYYTPFKEEGFAAIDRLLLKKGIPEEVKNQTRLNLLFYVENLKDAQLSPIKIAPPRFHEETVEHYHPMNSSIVKTPHGYLLLCRTVNYDRSLHFKSRNPLESSIRSRNFLLNCDANFNVLSQKEITEDFPRPYERWSIEGLEDCRVFNFKNHLWFTCATTGTHPSIGQTLCQLADDDSGNSIKVEKWIPLNMPNPHRHEKNWLPLIQEDELYAIYSYDPLIIYKIDMQTGNRETVHQATPPYDFSRFRGSAAPIAFDDGYLMLVHEVIVDKHDYYLHRFAFLDKNWKIKKLSKPFFFKHKGVEYCAGMTLDHSGNQCIMPISIEDQEAWLCSVPVATIRSVLEPLP